MKLCAISPEMRILFVGDLVGRPGREAMLALAAPLRRRLALDVIVVNCENGADGGKGIAPDQADALLNGGVDVLTGGNHLWYRQDIKPYLEGQPRLIRPANHKTKSGKGSYIHTLPDGRTLGVAQFQGRIFMQDRECPFACANGVVRKLATCTATIVDFHAEATSEKQAMGWHLDGRVSAVLGTHTHVATADERILPKGTAYITDVGMTGPMDSVIGLEVGVAVSRFVEGRHRPHSVATDNVWLCGAVIEIDDLTGRALSIERFTQAFEG